MTDSEEYLELFVPGTVRAQGSLQMVTKKYAKYSDTTVEWRNTLVDRLRVVVEGTDYLPWSEPVSVLLHAVMARPKYHYVAGKPERGLRDNAPDRHSSAPDIDKIARCVLDALTIAGVLEDDGLVSQLVVDKEYTSALFPVPGMNIWVLPNVLRSVEGVDSE